MMSISKSKIIIPVNDRSGESASETVKRSFYIAWFQVINKQIIDRGIVSNPFKTIEGLEQLPDIIMSLEVNIIISFIMGKKELDTFQGLNVSVLQADSFSTTENLLYFLEGELKEFSEY